jgi:hypothetical protein
MAAVIEVSSFKWALSEFKAQILKPYVQVSSITFFCVIELTCQGFFYGVGIHIIRYCASRWLPINAEFKVTKVLMGMTTVMNELVFKKY